MGLVHWVSIGATPAIVWCRQEGRVFVKSLQSVVEGYNGVQHCAVKDDKVWVKIFAAGLPTY